MDETLRRIKEFHGHLGPYAAMGYRMGLLANRLLGDSAFRKRAVALCGIRTPVSCMIDGIQLATGCTMGKGNMLAEDRNRPAAIFSDREGTRTVEIALKPELHDWLMGTMTHDNGEELAARIFSMGDDELFDVTER